MNAVCEICRDPLEGGQRRRHFTCCAAGGGRPDDVCRPILAKVDGYTQKTLVCAHCWTPSTNTTGRAA